jgi:SAM-dependent methyltransferase
MESTASVRRKVYDSPTHDFLVDWVSERLSPGAGTPRLLLDLGCGTGSNLELLSDRGFEVVGLTLSNEEAIACSNRGHSVVVADASVRLPFADDSFDVVFASHVLEHLADPWNLLGEVKRVLAPQGVVYAAIPNVVFIKSRLEYLCGRFRYEDSGTLDKTHLRFFDLKSAYQLFESCGFEVSASKHLGWMPAGRLRRMAPNVIAHLDGYLTRKMPNLFAQQFVFEARLGAGY